MKPIKLSVRKVVEHVLRCGDIDNRHADSASMQDGARAHRKIQRAMGPAYQKEVSLQIKTEISGIPVILQGRADGVIIDDAGSLTIDEIKSTALPLEQFYQHRELHLGQAKCYAWMLLQHEELRDEVQEVIVQLTYYQLETEELQRHQFPFSREELELFFLGLLERYGVWLQFELEWRALRDESIQKTGFPYPAYRRGQRELAVAAYRAIEQGKRLYAQAPTGIGKTLSTLFPAVKALGEDKAEKLFYLTAKTVTRGVAQDAVGLMADNGLRLKSVTLRAKDKICPQEERICNPDYCPSAKGHYDRVNDALLDMLTANDMVTPEIVGEYAKKHRVCPHEMALDATLWADLIIGDYNHVFDPTVYLKRFFSEGGGDYVFLIDEAHNLGDRVRDMYTECLRRSRFVHISKTVRGRTKPVSALRKTARQLSAFLLDMGEQCGEEKVRVLYEQLDEDEAGGELQSPAKEDTNTKVLSVLLYQFTEAAEEWLGLEGNRDGPLHQEVLELYFDALAFLGICERYDERFVTIVEAQNGDVAYTLYCLDPSAIIGELMGRGKASVLFSATLTPLPYYREILGGREGDWVVSLPSPFDEGHLLLAAHCGISTKYTHRQESIAPLAQVIHQAVQRQRGNYLVFFPSYAYMRQVYEEFSSRYPQMETLLQQDAMDEEVRAAFLHRFDGENAETLVGFCVLGGIFSEGIDLKGDRLIGSVIVGVGLPGISLRQDLIRDYFNRKNGRGYDYAYVFPGMNKVLQAAGRVIRSEEDRGLVLLVDSRFGTQQYRELYPAHWSGMRYIRSQKELEALLADFPGFAAQA